MDAQDPAEVGDEANGERADREALVRGYYESVDDGDYDRLASLLAPEFVHDRPDRTLSDREAFVSFMREDRPEKDTEHDLTAVYRAVDDDGNGDGDGDGDAAEGWVAHGRLVGADGRVRFEFVDVFALSDDGVTRIETFAREG
ncbi:ntf2 domain-containing protein [Halogeometricum pallidum JCM 14848]|uniref:Ntf2 domain-containing protein n=1 Tax=Halogeometricum pallidum JCM 14848 TaxID=1227487 RepID=M0DIT0_HALPD|nr:nuclear transport factor 2 family protein [Halogeometricum pallidum]ELZ34064.1 ntf2 domain-containing protein [Halogeometricum pallidum JCM 14848]